MAGVMELITKVDSTEAGGDGTGNGVGEGIDTGNGSTIVQTEEARGSAVVEAGNGTGEGEGNGVGTGNVSTIVQTGDALGSAVVEAGEGDGGGTGSGSTIVQTGECRVSEVVEAGNGTGEGDDVGTGNGSTIVQTGEARASEVVEAGNGTGEGDGVDTGNGSTIVEIGDGNGYRIEFEQGYGSEVGFIEFPGYRIPRTVQVRVPTGGGGGGARAGRGNGSAAVVGGGGRRGRSGGNVDVVPGGGGGPAMPPGVNPAAGFQVLLYGFDRGLDLRLLATHTFPDIIPANFESWDLLGRRLRLVFNLVHPNITNEQIGHYPGEHNPPLEQVTVQNCWPGGVVTFGRLVIYPGDQFPSFGMLNWTHLPFPLVREALSCVAVLEPFSRPQ